MTVAAWIALAAPLASVFLITLGGNRLSRRAAGYLATAFTFASFGAAVYAFVALWTHDESDRTFVSTGWTWLSAGGFHAGMSILVDPLSVFMMLIVSGVGSLIVAYSVGYMDGSDEERRFFAYMSLFVFSMLLLVESSNLLLLLCGWGMVGLSSYLLIGYDHDRPAAIAAAKKAFVMNAFGDATMALSLFLLIQHTGTLDYAATFDRAPGGTLGILIALGLLGGAVAKSAQLPLQTWLPDAMEGPTPVSALIHAATMVTAGVYLIVRTHPLFENAAVVQDTAAALGAVTLVMAGLIALVQVDIKRVIAYSTMSQIGYMFLGAGLGAYANGMFHLMTHAFFKALLFLAAGIAIHALAGEQDIRKMQGIGRLMPYTSIVFLAGSLALVGIPPFAGFFSKDAILASALDRGGFGVALFALGELGALLTGIYTFRLWFIVFRGEPTAMGARALPPPPRQGGARLDAVAGRDPRRARGDRRLDPVLALLARRSRTGSTPSPRRSSSRRTRRRRSPACSPSASAPPGSRSPGRSTRPGGCRCRARPFWQRTLEHKFWFDELYYARLLPARPTCSRAGSPTVIEQPLIAGSLSALGLGAHEAWEGTSRAQTGLVRSYVLALAGAMTALVIAFVVAR